MWYWSVDNLLSQSRLRQTAIVNMYHVTKVSLNLSFTVHFNCTEISRDSHQFYTEELFKPVFVCSFSIWEFLNLPFAVNVTLRYLLMKPSTKTNATKSVGLPFPPFPDSPLSLTGPERVRLRQKNLSHRHLAQLAPFIQALDCAIYWINHYPGGLINSKIKDSVI